MRGIMSYEFDLAVACGLTRRFGPSPSETVAMPLWKRALLKVMPVRHRWKLSSLAPRIREFEQRIASATPG